MKNSFCNKMILYLKMIIFVKLLGIYILVKECYIHNMFPGTPILFDVPSE